MSKSGWSRSRARLALRPTVLLLDEPAAGLSRADKAPARRRAQAIAELGVAVILVEHDMALVMGISDTVLVLDAGRPIAAGTPVGCGAIRGAQGLSRRRRAHRASPSAATRHPGRGPDPRGKRLEAGYGGDAALRGIDLDVGEGQSVAVLGANGAGKTTLMRALAGLEPPAARGEIRFAGPVDRSRCSAPARSRRARAGAGRPAGLSRARACATTCGSARSRIRREPRRPDRDDARALSAAAGAARPARRPSLRRRAADARHWRAA